MTVVAMWCRHIGDNVIGIGGRIPWNVASDAKHFLDVVKGQAVVCGRKTYERLPGRTIVGSRMFVMSLNADYEVTDAVNHGVISGQKALADFEDDLYIAGGAKIHELFMKGKEGLKPDIIVDCKYEGKMLPLEGEKADVTASVSAMEKGYRKISPDYCLDMVKSAVWIKKGRFVEQSVLKRIVGILEEGAEVIF